MNVAVVIVTHNHLRDVQACLASLHAQTYRDFGIYVSDNQSGDGTAEWVRDHCSSVHVIENRANLGFAEGCNVGLRLALEAGAKFLILLNPDTVVDPHWLEELVRTAEGDPSIGVCQSKIYCSPPTSPPVINTAGNRLHYTGIGFCGNLGEVDRGQFNEDVEIAYASGAAMMMKSQVARDIGLLDSDLFMYHEDLDWSLRARLQGHRVVLSARSIVWHDYNFRKGPAKFFFIERNRLIWLCKTYPSWLLVLTAPALLALEAAILYYALVGGWLGSKLRSYVDVLRLSGNWRRSRRKLRSTCINSDRYLVAALSSRLSLPDAEGSRLFRLADRLFDYYWRFCLRWVH